MPLARLFDLSGHVAVVTGGNGGIGRSMLPAPGEMKAFYSHGLATIIRLSISCEDSRVRLRAAQWLCAEAEKREKLEAARTPNQRDEVLAELRGLYQRAFSLPTQQPLLDPLVKDVDGVTATEESEGLLCGDGLEPSVESAAPDERAACNSAAAEAGGSSGATIAPTSEPLIMERVTPPGYFPPKFKRVPAR